VDATAQFGKNVRRVRTEAGMTQQALADAIQMLPSEVSRIERGGRDPQLFTMLRVARGLGVPLRELVADIE
jgi:transcriptional regulator with XRE-family HTH domain